MARPPRSLVGGQVYKIATREHERKKFLNISVSDAAIIKAANKGRKQTEGTSPAETPPIHEVVGNDGKKPVKTMPAKGKKAEDEDDTEDHAKRLADMVGAYAAANKCTISKAYDAMTSTPEGKALRQQDARA